MHPFMPVDHSFKIMIHFFIISFFYPESAPTWHVKPHNVTLYKGQQYTLPCRTYGYPIPIHYWTKNGAAISIADPDVLAGKNDLYFYAANTRHSGLYTCSAYNRHGSVSHSVYVKVVSGMVFGCSSVQFSCKPAVSWGVHTFIIWLNWGEKKHSEWFPEWSEFCYTDC